MNYLEYLHDGDIVQKTDAITSGNGVSQAEAQHEWANYVTPYNGTITQGDLFNYTGNTGPNLSVLGRAKESLQRGMQKIKENVPLNILTFGVSGDLADGNTTAALLMMSPEKLAKIKPIVEKTEKRISDFYKSDEYFRRLKQMGMTDAEANARIKQLNENMANAVVKVKPLEDLGVTSISDYPGKASIEISDHLSDTELSDAILEELLHSSTFNGQSAQNLEKYKQSLIKRYGSLDKAIESNPKLKYILDSETGQIIRNLNNDTVERNNNLHKGAAKGEVILQDFYSPQEIEALKQDPKKFQQAIDNIRAYYNESDEARARGITRVMEEMEHNNGKFQIPLKLTEQDEMSGLANEATKYYYNAPNYLEYVTGLSAPLILTSVVKEENEK